MIRVSDGYPPDIHSAVQFGLVEFDAAMVCIHNPVGWQDHRLDALTVDPRGRFWGADGDGQVWTTGDGSAWDSIGRVDGQAQAAFADNDSVWIALHGDDRTTTITRTDDDGRSWTTVYREPPPLAP